MGEPAEDAKEGDSIERKQWHLCLFLRLATAAGPQPLLDAPVEAEPSAAEAQRELSHPGSATSASVKKKEEKREEEQPTAKGASADVIATSVAASLPVSPDSATATTKAQRRARDGAGAARAHTVPCAPVLLSLCREERRTRRKREEERRRINNGV